ncbi:MAG: heme biosynthesis protein HemY [Rhizobiales bacterium]|nr:heme biosynthesis protein HemY [Hyphomicrobiales bacterium]
MVRILFFLLVVFALGLGFAWLADRPGEMVVTFDGYQYQVSLMVAAVAVVAIVAAVMILWWLVRTLWNSPYLVSRYFRVRRRDRGYQALSTGIIAAGAGYAVRARALNKQAAKLISADQEPLIHLLDAQASILEGDHDAARRKFEAMLDDPEMRLLGLHGLYLEAERLGEREVSRHYAARAAELAPQLGWAADATLDDRAARGDWDGALKLVDAQKTSKQLGKEAADRRRAVLLTGKAMALAETDRAASRAAALEANRLQPHFVPAALAAARACFRQDDVRKGAKILETAWRAEPHPEIADLYIHARPGDAIGDRLHRAKKLQALRQNNAESALAVARAALDAHDFRLARAEAESAARIQPQERAYLLLADIEEAETGDQGRIRHWLARAVRAPRDPAWVADGHVSDSWAPFSPVTGRLDAFEWKVPVERVGQLIEQEDEPLPALTSGAEKTASDTPAHVVVPAEPPADVPAGKPEAAAAPVVESVAPETEKPVLRPVPDAADATAAPVAAFDAAHPPDDPGVDPSEANDNQPRKFRLF